MPGRSCQRTSPSVTTSTTKSLAFRIWRFIMEYEVVGMGRLASRPWSYSIRHPLRHYQKIPKPSSRNSVSAKRPARPNPIASSYFFGGGLDSSINQCQNRILTRNKDNPKYYQEIILPVLKTLTWAVVGHILMQSRSNSWELIPE